MIMSFHINLYEIDAFGVRTEDFGPWHPERPLVLHSKSWLLITTLWKIKLWVTGKTALNWRLWIFSLMTVLPPKQGSTDHRLKWRKRKQALLSHTENIKIQISKYLPKERRTQVEYNCSFIVRCFLSPDTWYFSRIFLVITWTNHD